MKMEAGASFPLTACYPAMPGFSAGFVTIMSCRKNFGYSAIRQFDKRRGFYGTIGDRTVIKNCKIVKDVIIGTDAYLKGANKLKNLTINSSAKSKTQIGEGCELGKWYYRSWMPDFLWG